MLECMVCWIVSWPAVVLGYLHITDTFSMVCKTAQQINRFLFKVKVKTESDLAVNMTDD